jgi:hypothetical protein
MSKTYIITGFYGSGKTEFTVNLAKQIAGLTGTRTTIADLDVINPYFRSREKAKELSALGIEIMGDSLNNNTGQDLPAVSFGFLSRIKQGENVLIDLAGGTNGINLLASCYETITNHPYEFLCILNLYRPETASAKQMLDFVSTINNISKLKITGLVNNGHMLHYTEPEHILNSQSAILEVSKKLQIPLKYTQLKQSLHNEIKTQLLSEKILTFNKLTMRETWQ